jgi:hypothetical protein
MTTRGYRYIEREDDDTLHADPATERCNLDDSLADHPVDADTARHLLKDGAKLCAHCQAAGLFDELNLA